jgi:undecaprenyl-phosphate galactose phosphotransferase
MSALLFRLILLAFDSLLLGLAFRMGLGDSFLEWSGVGPNASAGRIFLFQLVLWSVLAWQEGLFRLVVQDAWGSYFAALRAMGRAALLMALPLFLFRFPLPPSALLGSLLLAMILLPAFRAMAQWALIGRLPALRQAVVVGTPHGLRLFFALPKWQRTCRALDVQGILVLGPLSDEDRAHFPLPLLGSSDSLADVARQRKLRQVLVCAMELDSGQLSHLLRSALGSVQQLYILPDIAALDIAEVEIGRVGGQPVLLFNQGLRSPFNAALKRAVDILGSLVALVALSPILVLVALLVKELLARDPAARAEWEANYKLRRDPRITPVGRFLRKVSLDELPQILNVLKGDISLVGPRPVVDGEIDKYTVWQENRNSVRPGLTGLWQVSGRNDVDFEDRIKLDMYYIRNWSFWLDVRIVLKTLTVLVSKEGAY